MNADLEVITNGNPSQLPLNVRTIPRLLKENASYATFYTGKWDLGMTSWGCSPPCRGIDESTYFFVRCARAHNEPACLTQQRTCDLVSCRTLTRM